MRILHTVASLSPETGGPARSVPGLANALANLGVEVHVCSPEIPEEWEDSRKFVLHRGPLANVLDALPGLDLVHDHGLWLPVNHQVAVACQRRKIPRLVSPRGMLEPWALNHRKWKKRIAWQLYQKRDLHSAVALHATADSEAGQFQRLGLTNRVFTISNGVDAGLFPDFRAPSSEPKTALFLGRIHPKKGLPLLVEAWAQLRPPGWRMRIVGPDENGHRAEIERLVREKGLSDDWLFTGPLEGEAKREAFSQADLFILPTYSENFGIAIAEALASAIPVITTTGAPWEGIPQHRCGWWVNADAGELRGALEQATTMDANVLREMGVRGASWMKSHFTWDGAAKKMLVAYQALLSSL